jgi:hypothetical protein
MQTAGRSCGAKPLQTFAYDVVSTRDRSGRHLSGRRGLNDGESLKILEYRGN